MTGHRPFSDLRERIPPERSAANIEATQTMLRELPEQTTESGMTLDQRAEDRQPVGMDNQGRQPI